MPIIHAKLVFGQWFRRKSLVQKIFNKTSNPVVSIQLDNRFLEMCALKITRQQNSYTKQRGYLLFRSKLGRNIVILLDELVRLECGCCV